MSHRLQSSDRTTLTSRGNLSWSQCAKTPEQLQLIEKAKERCGKRHQDLIDSVVHNWDWEREAERRDVYPKLLERIIDLGPHEVLYLTFTSLKQCEADEVLVAMWHVLRDSDAMDNLLNDLLFNDKETHRHFAIEQLQESVHQGRTKEEILRRALDSDDEYVRDYAAVQLAVFTSHFSSKRVLHIGMCCCLAKMKSQCLHRKSDHRCLFPHTFHLRLPFFVVD